ncbi:MAG: PrkA family serine protein kinase [Planctomycetaceae bacterium]
MHEPHDTDRLATKLREAFSGEKRILAYEAWLEELRRHPYRLLRSSAQYVRDMFDHFGWREVESLGRKRVRHQLFDGVPGDPEGQRVVGQEAACDQVYRIVRNFAQEGRADKLILMHGPNGSSKSSIADMIFKGLEAYSHTPEGALYRFAWVFPKAEVDGRGLGFQGAVRRSPEGTESYAFLPPEEIATIVPSDMKTNPALLIPREHREEYLRDVCKGVPDFPFRHILRGDLGTKSRAFFDALMTAHQGDWKRVMRYVRVERFYVSRRYRTAAVTIEPQMHVDAEARQATADMTLVNLPPALQNLRLYEVGGDLVDANRGLVEFSDILKRPLELNKYLLTTTEKGTLRIPGAMAYVDLVMIGSANEKQLDAFKTDPNFTSFKGRMELVLVPYLLEYEKEMEIYRDQLAGIRRRMHLAPHAARSAALWAVLTRLWRPDPAHYEEPLKSVVARLTPLAKALLYQGKDPSDLEDLSPEDVKLLRANLERLAGEFRDGPVYEGRFGASPREMKTILLDASYRTESKCFTPITVLAELRNLVRDKTVHDFLKLEPRGGYNDPARFVEDVERALVRVVARETREAMGLIEEAEYDRRFERYFHHVIAYVRRTKVSDPLSGEGTNPDPTVLDSVERLLPTGRDIDLFRQNLIAKVGAWSVSRAGEKVNFRGLFPEILRALKEDFYQRRKETIRQVEDDLLVTGTPAFEYLSPERKERVETTLANLEARYGYVRESALEMGAYAIRRSRVLARE